MPTSIAGISRLAARADPELPPVPPAALAPFDGGRDAIRLLFDFAAMCALMNRDLAADPVLDFGAGSGWISELCVRMGFDSVAFDIHGDLKGCLEARIHSDRRIEADRLAYAHGDGHSMPFEADVFGNLLCYDTLHHMRDYERVFAEFFRVLKPGGRAVFVEPGARHSTSRETIEFVATQKQHDPDWIERDVVLEEIDRIARAAGFAAGIQVTPLPLPLSLPVYPMQEWSRFRAGKRGPRAVLSDRLARENYLERVIFYAEKPRERGFWRRLVSR